MADEKLNTGPAENTSPEATVCRGSYSYQHFIFAVITESIKCCCSFSAPGFPPG